MKKILGFFILFIVMFSVPHKQVLAANNLWDIQSIDTMKLSRDNVRDTHIDIEGWVKKIADLHANYIAIDTPYDEEFYPVLKKWVVEARKNNLHVWFRGNFSGWEGWFDYPKLHNATQHYALTKAFILKHPDLFADDDIFTPAPEPENGIIGDPRSSKQSAINFNNFLVMSFITCTNSMKTIHVQVKCGYFSVNGDIARDILTKNTVDTLGQIVIDHYVSTVNQMTEEVDYLSSKFNKPVIIGEFGAPLNEINGSMDDTQQAEFIRTILSALYTRAGVVQGFNYWVITGGSTELITSEKKQKEAASSILDYYNPTMISGNVKDTLGNPLQHIQLQTWTEKLRTDSNGNYHFFVPQGTIVTISTQTPNYKPYSHTLLSNQNINNISLTPLHNNTQYSFLEFWQKIISFFEL